MRILSIDPGSNIHATSTTGVVLMDNATLIYQKSVPYGVTNFYKWWNETGSTLKYDVAIVEKFEARHNDYSRDNTVQDVIDAIHEVIPDVIEQRNAGYETDIPAPLMKKLGLWSFSQKTHHHDIRSATRLALFWAMRNNEQDVIDDIGQKLQKALN